MAAKLYTYESNMPVTSRALFEFHKRSAAIQRLTPPWESVRIIEKKGGIQDQGTVIFQVRLGPFKSKWKARHEDYIEGSQFVDVQVQGPFKSWRHTHSFRSMGPCEATLKDTIQLELPFGSVGYHLGYGRLREKLNRMFTYRHTVTRADVEHWMLHQDKPRCKVVITGGNGLIGSELAVFLMAQGHDVCILSRSGKSRVRGAKGVRWNPAQKFIDDTPLEAVDCWIHLAGENISQGRWTDRRILKLWNSRVQITRFLVDYLSHLKEPPKVFISASGVGYYGECPDPATEETGKGRGILSNICQGWEDASQGLEKAGIRRVILRNGVVLSRKEGALAKMLPVFRAGLGGRLSGGSQYMSWIAMDDLLRIVDTVMLDESMEGVFNVVSPEPVTNREFTRTMGKVLNRPALFPVPAGVLRVAFGRMADETLLISQNVCPERLLGRDFPFHFGDLEIALEHSLGIYT